MKKLKLLREMILEEGFIQAPGAFDALTAKIVESAGFPAVYMTGYGTSVANYGLPDLGLLTMTEMVQNASRITDAVNIPLIADADTGFGNPINVHRTVLEYEKAGASAIHIEDQKWPKRCGHMSGKAVIDINEMTGKIKAAVDARRNDDFLIIARTDAIATHGFDHAIERGHAYADTGADIVFIEAPQTEKQIEQIPKQIDSKPLLINMGPLTPNLSATKLKEMGYAIAIYPAVCLAATISGCTEELNRITNTGSQRNFEDWMQSFSDLNNFLDVPFYMEIEQKYK